MQERDLNNKVEDSIAVKVSEVCESSSKICIKMPKGADKATKGAKPGNVPP